MLPVLNFLHVTDFSRSSSIRKNGFHKAEPLFQCAITGDSTCEVKVLC